MESRSFFGFMLVVTLAVFITLIIYVIEGEDENPVLPTSFWVAVGESEAGGRSNILYSDDGKEWKETTKGDSFSKEGFGVAYSSTGDGLTPSGPRWVAVGDDHTGGGTSYGNIMWSNNGTCWVKSSSGDSFSAGGRGIAYGSELWVAVGYDHGGSGTSYGNIMWSDTGGISWQETTTGASFSNQGLGVGYSSTGDGLIPSGPRWVAVGDDSDYDGSGTSYGNIKWSDNGKVWNDSGPESDYFEYYGRGVARGKDHWVAVGLGQDHNTQSDYYKNILRSTDGKHWNYSNPNGASFTREGNAVAYGDSIFVAVGRNQNSAPAPSNILWSSDDGDKWNYGEGASFPLTLLDDQQGFGVNYHNGLWVAVGQALPGSSFKNILYSDNGKFWYTTSKGASFTVAGNGVAGRS